MLKRRKFLTALYGLLYGAAVSAGTVGGGYSPNCSASGVTFPCDDYGWSVGAYALYLSPSYSLGYTGVGLLSGLLQNNNYINIKPDWGWGLKIDAAFYFNTGNDFNFNWLNYDKYSMTTVLDSSNQLTIFDQFGFNTFTTGGSLIRTTVEPSWNAFNFELGQRLDVGTQKGMRLHAGLQYAMIRTVQRIFFESPNRFLGTYSSAEQFNSAYIGIGPRLGADLFYEIHDGFSVYGNIAGTILAGYTDFGVQFEDNITILNAAELENSIPRKIVPEIESSLGLKYDFRARYSTVTIDAGWMWLNYFNAVTYALSSTSESSFGLQGLYFGVKWKGEQFFV